MDSMAKWWKLVDAVWDYDVWGYPPAFTRLSDAVVFKLLLKKIAKVRSENWPFDFNSRGQMRFEREPHGPAVWIERKGRYYYPEIGGRYILGGEIAGRMDSWFIEPPSYVTRRDSIYFGRVEVPSWAKDQGAIIVSSRGVTGLTFDDEDRISWDGMSGTPVIWAKEVSLECPTSLTRATVFDVVETQSGQDAILVAYDPDEEQEDAQVSTKIIDVKKEELKREAVKKERIAIKSEVVNRSQRLHLPRTPKRKPESLVNRRSKRGKATSSALKKEEIPIKSEAVNGTSELDLKNEPDVKPPTTTPQQQPSAHNRTPRILKREPEPHIVTGHNKRGRARSSALTQGSNTESWVEMASTMIRQAASADREHQALIRSICEDVKSLQSRIDALKASAPLPRALQDVRKLMAEHEDDVLGTDQVARTMQIILQKLPS
ncbi:uncharacterized protein P174DRAFT_432934 [Aspergillus novofumigatus IBT 16806]|uniref:Uncharacterized protein n=1 Tax=Aspergillus novofumigatus (strain IBT 16806) TaxID=1392255 RepID=A0A2I1C1L2_ASPN1|nr:uncharacterized protein P174DRAFT_432934 [Aspergillus novofumigatus IBT 16806]PKX91483.1 hypothetical protein P174DRAFT_432934 [Aspergillus novofumigatus IBT 16806]